MKGPGTKSRTVTLFGLGWKEASFGVGVATLCLAGGHRSTSWRNCGSQPPRYLHQLQRDGGGGAAAGLEDKLFRRGEREETEARGKWAETGVMPHFTQGQNMLTTDLILIGRDTASRETLQHRAKICLVTVPKHSSSYLLFMHRHVHSPMHAYTHTHTVTQRDRQTDTDTHTLRERHIQKDIGTYRNRGTHRDTHK